MCLEAQIQTLLLAFQLDRFPQDLQRPMEHFLILALQIFHQTFLILVEI